MTIPLWCLLGFAAWTLLLVLSVVSWRSVMVLRGDKRANEFTPGVEHGPIFYWRLNRAHVNAAENLPVIGAVVVVATLIHLQSPLFDTLAQVHLVARIVQTIAHLASNRVAVVYVRFTALLVQIACLAWMMKLIVSHG